MKRRRLLGTAAVTGALAGCLDGFWVDGTASDSSHDRTVTDSVGAGGDADPNRNQTRGESENETDGEAETEQTVAQQFDCESARRPSCDVEAGEYVFEAGDTAYETVGTVAYPKPPDEVTESTALIFAKDHERSYQQNADVCPENETITSYTATVPATETFDWYDDIFVVRLELMVGVEYRDHDSDVVDIGDLSSAAVYAIDETGAARVETDHHQEPADPIESGELVTCF
ncbi:hypothetical protein AB7C87_06735 [Natrarchaeobius sp. A-rgal3]|uniref:hypothetical protein n=1 Tax=Natrarchaeobius versutus TaxID=1679078 RepID=UPI00350F55F3